MNYNNQKYFCSRSLLVMSDETSHIPWQAWVIVTLLCSGISAWSVIEASKQSNSQPNSIAESNSPSIPSPISDVNIDETTNTSTQVPSTIESSMSFRSPEEVTDSSLMARVLNESDLVNKSKWELYVMRNEIFARHGRRFKNEDLQIYFDKQTWYIPKYLPDEFPSSILSSIEKQNVQIIMKREKELNSHLLYM